MSGQTLPINIAAQFSTDQYLDSNTLFLEALINASWLEGLGLKDEAKAAIAEAMTTFLSTLAPPDMTAASLTPSTVDEPVVTIPTDATVTDVFDTFRTEYIELATWLAGEYHDLITEFFPEDAATYSAAESWIQAAVANLNGGMPATVQTQMFEDDRARILADAGRAEAEALATFASRGMSLPPGGAANAVLQIQQRSLDQVAESSRKIAAQSIEMMRWAVGQAVGLRQLALGAAGDYVKALASAPEMVSKMTNVGYDAQQKLISATASYYQARVAAKELTFKGNAANAGFTQQANEENMRSELTLIGEKTKALMTQIGSLTQLANGMLNNLHAQIGGSNVNSRTLHVQG
jgi:hypothetical protein